MKAVCSDRVNSLAKYLQGMLFCPMSEIRCEVVYIYMNNQMSDASSGAPLVSPILHIVLA
jgi:hypothetical protein